MSTNSDMDRDWLAKKDYVVLFAVFLALPFVSQAGGLGIAAIMAIGGGLALAGYWPGQLLRLLKTTPAALWLVLALLIWGLISSLWSPFVSNRTMPNPAILVVGVPLYLACAHAVVAQSKFDSSALIVLIIMAITGSAIAILIDLMSGYSISLAVDPVSVGEDPQARRGDLFQNISQGISVLALFLSPVTVLLFKRGLIGKIIAIALAMIIIVSALKVNASASLLAIVAAITFMLMAQIFSKKVLKFSFLLAGASLAFAPVLAFFATKIPDDQLANLPLSWEERVHNWRFLYGKILEHPVFGHGFDAVRTFNETHAVRGYEGRALVSLHPHNAGLHIWTELGLVGIVLGCTALFFGIRHLCNRANLSRSQFIATSGLVAAATISSGLSYGVWQDWWWASIILAGATIALIPDSKKPNNLK